MRFAQDGARVAVIDLIQERADAVAAKIKSVNDYYDHLDQAAADLKKAVDANDEDATNAALHTIAQWQNAAHEDFLSCRCAPR